LKQSATAKLFSESKLEGNDKTEDKTLELQKMSNNQEIIAISKLVILQNAYGE
jgi:hypothetical protein